MSRVDRLGVRGALPRLSGQMVDLVADLDWHVQFYPVGGDLLGEWVPDADARRAILPNHPRAVYGFPG